MPLPTTTTCSRRDVGISDHLPKSVRGNRDKRALCEAFDRVTSPIRDAHQPLSPSVGRRLRARNPGREPE
jgi:hypothetical protein